MSSVADLTKFPFPPDQASYVLTDGSAVVSTTLDGGSARYRLDLLDVANTIVVQWTFDPIKYQYWKAFYDTIIVKGSLPFALDLYMDQAVLTTHEVHIVPGTLTLASQSGLTFVVGCTIEAIPLPIDDVDNTAFINLYNIYGDNTLAMLNALQQLTNYDLAQI